MLRECWNWYIAQFSRHPHTDAVSQMLAVWSAEIHRDARPGNGNTPLTAALPVAGWQRRLEAGLRSPHTCTWLKWLLYYSKCGRLFWAKIQEIFLVLFRNKCYLKCSSWGRVLGIIFFYVNETIHHDYFNICLSML